MFQCLHKDVPWWYSIEKSYKHIAQRFPLLVEKSPFQMWEPGKSTCTKGKRILLGIAPQWNLQDLQYLDSLAKLMAHFGVTERVEVFDASDLCSYVEIAQYIPTLEKPKGYPLVGIWQNGHLQKVDSNYSARRLVIQELFGTKSEEESERLWRLGLQLSQEESTASLQV